MGVVESITQLVYLWNEWNVNFAHTICVSRTQWEGTTRKTRCVWEDNIKLDLIEIGYEMSLIVQPVT
jgi:hypothetical protein